MIVHRKDCLELLQSTMKLSRHTVQTVMRRPDFPSPVRVIGSYKAYDLDQVADFLAIPANEPCGLIIPVRGTTYTINPL
jgi:hypothetical protein